MLCVWICRESRGFAFLSFVDPSHAAVAIEHFDNKTIFGDGSRPVRVERAKRNKPHNPTPGFYKGPPGMFNRYFMRIFFGRSCIWTIRSGISSILCTSFLFLQEPA